MAHKKKNSFVVGLRQVLRELKNSNITAILLATDVEASYKQQIYENSKHLDVKIVEQGTVLSLAQQFGIEVPTGVVGYLKNI